MIEFFPRFILLFFIALTLTHTLAWDKADFEGKIDQILEKSDGKRSEFMKELQSMRERKSYTQSEIVKALSELERNIKNGDDISQISEEINALKEVTNLDFRTDESDLKGILSSVENTGLRGNETNKDRVRSHSSTSTKEKENSSDIDAESDNEDEDLDVKEETAEERSHSSKKENSSDIDAESDNEDEDLDVKEETAEERSHSSKKENSSDIDAESDNEDEDLDVKEE
eukprot:g2258.t1